MNTQPGQLCRHACRLTLRRGQAPLPVLAAASAAGVLLLAALIVVFVRRGGNEELPPVGAQQADESGVPSDESLQPAEAAAPGGDGTSPERVRAAVEAAVLANAALLDSPAPVALMNSRGDAAGDVREANPAASDAAISARNWELHFLRGSTLENYARQLDHFGIELGVLQPGNKLVYAAGLSQPKPQSRSGRADAENRYYLTWCESESQQADRELLARAGMTSDGSVILKFLPPALETQLAGLEKKYAAGRPGAIVKTSFAVRVEGDGYALHVIEQKRK